MTQQRLTFSTPSTDVSFRTPDVPVQGCSQVARMASASGRQAVRLKSGSQAARVLAALQESPKTDLELVAATGLVLTTVLARRWMLIHKGLVQREPVGVKRHGEALNAIWGVR